MKKDWEIKKLGEIGNIFSGNSINEKEKKTYMDLSKKGLFYVATKDISTDSKIEYENGILIPDECLSKYKIAHKNSVLICAEGGSAGKKLAFNSEYDICFVNKLFAFESKKSIFPKFVFYYYQSSDFSKNFKNRLAGLIGGVSLQKFKEIPCPFPTLEEQKRIVKILDEKFAQLERLKTNAQTNLQNAKDLFQSQLTKAFSNTTWEKKRLGDLCSKIGSGATPKGGKDSYKTEGIHLVRSMNVYDNEFVYDELACIDDKQAYELRNVELQEDDVLFNITGASVCRCCVLPSDVLPARVNQHVSILRPKQELLNPTFLCSVMLGYKEILYKIACAGGSTRQAITKAQLEDFEIPLPPLPEQKRIVKELDTLNEKVRLLQEIYTKQIANCDELKQSLLQKAFEGEL